MPTPKDPKADDAAVAAANAANENADDATVADAETNENDGKLVVLMRGFIARVDAKEKTLTRRYRLGEEFHPVEGIHDVESLIQQRVIGRVGDGELKRTTALSQAQAQAQLNDEESPVVDLEFQPFTQRDVNASSNPELATSGLARSGGSGQADVGGDAIDPTTDLSK